MNTAKALRTDATVIPDMREAVDYALATMRLEGFQYGNKELADLELIAQGKVTPEDSIKQIIRNINQ